MENYEEVTISEINCIFKPFDRVLLRFTDNDTWHPRFFGTYNQGSGFKFKDINGFCWTFCIHYEGNEEKAYTKEY